MRIIKKIFNVLGWFNGKLKNNYIKEEKLTPESTPRILCSAIWFMDDETYPHQPKNITTGFVISGHRHHNCFSTTWGLKGKKKITTREGHAARNIHGFLTSDNKFVNKIKAAEIAFTCGQIDKNIKRLNSEDLY